MDIILYAGIIEVPYDKLNNTVKYMEKYGKH